MSNTKKRLFEWADGKQVFRRAEAGEAELDQLNVVHGYAENERLDESARRFRNWLSAQTTEEIDALLKAADELDESEQGSELAGVERDGASRILEPGHPKVRSDRKRR